MYKRFLTLAASGMLIFGLACGAQASAQSDSGTPSNSNAQANPQAPPPGHGHMRPGMRINVDEQLEHMSRMLNLTDDQKSQIKPILEDTHHQMRALHSDTSLSNEDRRTKIHALMQDAHAKIRAILTDEQNAKFDAMHGHGHEHMRKPPEGAGSQ